MSTQCWSLHRHPGAFPDPEAFLPERWEKPTKAMKDIYMPFGGGSRSKPGPAPPRRFAKQIRFGG